MKGQSRRQITLQAATAAALGGLDKGSESWLGNPEVKSLELFIPLCAGSQLNEPWPVKKKTISY